MSRTKSAGITTLVIGLILVLFLGFFGNRGEDENSQKAKAVSYRPTDQKWVWTIATADGKRARGNAQIVRFDGRQIIFFAQFYDQNRRVRTANFYIAPQTSLNGTFGDGNWLSPAPFYMGKTQGQLSQWQVKIQDDKGVKDLQGFMDGVTMNLTRVDD